MSNVTQITDYIGKWREVYRHSDDENGVTLVVFINDRTAELDIVQTNDEGESITTRLGKDAGLLFVANMCADVLNEWDKLDAKK